MARDRSVPAGRPDRQFVRELPSRLAQQLIELARRQTLGEDVHELCEQRNIRSRQQLLDFRRQLEHS